MPCNICVSICAFCTALLVQKYKYVHAHLLLLRIQCCGDLRFTYLYFCTKYKYVVQKYKYVHSHLLLLRRQCSGDVRAGAFVCHYGVLASITQVRVLGINLLLPEAIRELKLQGLRNELWCACVSS